ncbi:MAG TPA: DUF1549 domain-containing protein, partial [Pirellulaceae bacterium]|nr:DUF1549 domain-containing protein [Pirellulaceae bacterium]
MWAKNALFIVVCLVGAGAVANNLLRRDRIDRPDTFEPGRFEATSAAGAAETGGTYKSTLDKLNAQFHEHWQKKGLEVAPRADDLTIARRMSLALVGTVPSLEEIRALEEVEPQQRREFWTSHLLEDPRFGDYWAERLARAYAPPGNSPFIVFRRRRFTMWLADNIRENRPYDEMVRQMISETGVWTGKPAANWVTATSDPNKENQPDPVLLAGRTARAFLGMRIDCLQCHDDKLGNIMVGSAEKIHSGTQADFHQLAAFFGQTRVSLTGVQETNKEYKVKYLNGEEEETVPAKVPFSDELLNDDGSRREQLARWVTHPENKPFARATVNRVWALMFGKPLVEPIDDIPLVGRYPPGLQLLADDFVAHHYDLQRLIRLIAASDAFQRDSRAEFEITDQHENELAVFPLTRLRPEQMAGSLVQASWLTTINGQAHVFVQIGKFTQTNNFVERYGDLGQDEFTDRAGTIPQRLLMMNG